MNDTYKSIGLFIDGGYYAKINEALEEQLSLNINVTAFMSFIRQQVSLLSLITGDADHEILIRKLKALKIYTILLTWDVSDDKSTSTAKLLKDEACTHIELSKLLVRDKELLSKICKIR